MVKFGSYKTTLDIPFERFSNEFNTHVHFALQGIKKKIFNPATIEEHNLKYIRVWERRTLHCNYYPDEKNDTVVEYTAEVSAFVIIIWIVSCFLLVGLLYVPIYYFGGKFMASSSLKNVRKNGAQFIKLNFPPIEELPVKNKEDDKTEIEISRARTETIKTKASSSSSVPPPIPQKNNQEIYYVAVKEEQKGPYSIETLKVLIDLGILFPNTLVWREGMNNWTEATNLYEVKSLFEK